MIKKVLSLLLLAFLAAPNMTLAQNIGVSPSASISPEPTVIDSNELFWPLSAGKTIDDPLYFLKILKENLRGLLIFSEASKADYAVYLGTKRVLEAEKLLKEDKKDFAVKTFDEALTRFKEAQENIEKAIIKKSVPVNSIATMKPRLNNLTSVLPTLNFDKANEVLQKVQELNNKF